MPAGVCTQDFRSRFKSLFGIAILWRKKSNFIFKPKNKQQLGFAFLKLGENFFLKKAKTTHGTLFFFFQNFPENCVFFHSNNILQRFYRRLNCLFFFFFETIQNSTSEIAIFSKYKAFKRLTKQREYNSTSRVLTKEKKFGFQNTGFLFPSVNQSLNSVLLCSLSCTLCSACCSQHSLSKKISTQTSKSEFFFTPPSEKWGFP